MSSDILFVLAAAFLVMFAGVFRDRLRHEADGAATTALVGAGILAAGLAILSSFDYALAAHPAQLTASTAQVLNTVSNDAFFTAVMGGLVFGVCPGIAVLRASGPTEVVGRARADLRNRGGNARIVRRTSGHGAVVAGCGGRALRAGRPPEGDSLSTDTCRQPTEPGVQTLSRTPLPLGSRTNVAPPGVGSTAIPAASTRASSSASATWSGSLIS